MTLRYCKQEFLASTSVFLFSVIATCAVVFSVLFFQLNENRLPLKFDIVFLPFKGTSVNWLINYLYQAFIASLSGPFLFSFFSLTWIMMHQCCWGLDVIVEKITDKSDLKEIVEKSVDVINFQEKVQKLFKFIFLFEFTVLSFIFCLCLYTIAFDPFGSVFVYAMTLVASSQLFVTCWMGNRVIDRFDLLIAAIYDVDWYTMNVSQQKEILIVLTWAQQMQGFNGIFNKVSMETFQAVS